MTSLPLDVSVFNFIHTASCTASPWAQFNSFVTNNSHHIWFFIILAIALWKKKAGWYPALMCIAGFFLAWHLSDEYLKPLFSRPRPFIELGTCVFGHKPSNTSFPSGHTLTAATMATLICLYNQKDKWLWIVSIIFAVFVGYTRIYLGVHFPTDVIGGAVLGYLIALVWFASTEWARKNYNTETSSS